MSQDTIDPPKKTPPSEADVPRQQNHSALRVGIIGCGAITEWAHLPAAQQTPGVRISALVDKDATRVSVMAKKWKVPCFTTELSESYDHMDAAVVALPNHLHAAVSIDLLKRGIHVLVEKPMALTSADCDRMIQASRETDAILSVGLVRRYLRSAIAARDLIRRKTLGRILSFSAEDGCVFSWPVASDYLLRKETAGGGVLMDLGAHTLDTLLWWLGDVKKLEYYDDSAGGVEANSLLRLEMESGAKGTIRLSRTCNLGQCFVIEGEEATMRVPLYENHLELIFTNAPFPLRADLLSASGKDDKQTIGDLFPEQFRDWVDAILGKHPQPISAEEAKRSIELIQMCYASRQKWDLPWL